MARVLVDVIDGPELDEVPGVHHANVVRHLRDHAQVVADEEDGRPNLFDELFHEGEDLRLDRDVEGARRLVRDQQGRLLTQGHRDHDALSHAAGEFVRIEVQDRLWIVDAHEPQVIKRVLAEIFSMQDA